MLMGWYVFDAFSHVATLRINLASKRRSRQCSYDDFPMALAALQFCIDDKLTQMKHFCVSVQAANGDSFVNAACFEKRFLLYMGSE